MPKKIKLALIHRPSEQGFALPIAVGLGLIMLLIGTTMIVRSQGDRVTASAQKSTAQSLGTSETGITRVQSLLNKYDILSNITLSNVDTTPASSSWKQVYQNSTPATCGGAGGGTTEVEGYRLNQWIDLNSRSKFKVTEYTYKPDRFAPAQITADFTIPATASSSVTLNILPADYLTNGTSVNGQIKNIIGTLSRSGSTYTFTRLSSGTITNINALSTFIADPAAKVTGSVTIPASGSVGLTISPANYLVDGTSVEGQIGGIRGNLSRSGSNYTFTRLLTGTAITLTSDFYPTTTPGTSTLKVEGQVGDNSTAISHLQVSIPVQSASIDKFPVPGVFLNSGGTGKNSIKGNVLLRDCSVNPDDISLAKDPATNPKQPYLDPNTGERYKAQHTSAIFPTLPTPPPIITSPNNQNLGTPSKGTLTLPRTGDKPTNSNGVVDPNGVYRYSVTSIDDGTIIITPGKKVTFYLAGSISKKGGDIQHTCDGFTSEDDNSNGVLDTGEDNNSDGVLDTTCKPTDFQIFGYASASTPKPEICLNGNDFLEAFIFAPNYQAGVAGGGGGKGGFKGSIWVNDWSTSSGCGSSTSNIVVEQTASWTDIGLTPQNLLPKIAPITSWQREEAS